jgi:hypothetical protein
LLGRVSASDLTVTNVPVRDAPDLPISRLDVLKDPPGSVRPQWALRAGAGFVAID